MQNLREIDGVSVIDRALRFLSVRLKSRPASADLAPEIIDLRRKLHDADNVWQDAVTERMSDSAEITYLDEQVDDATMDVVRQVNVLTKNNASDERYRKLF